MPQRSRGDRQLLCQADRVSTAKLPSQFSALLAPKVWDFFANYAFGEKVNLCLIPTIVRAMNHRIASGFLRRA